MLDVEETIRRFGYDPRILKRYSEKPVVVVCDYCSVQTYPAYTSYLASNAAITCGARACRKKKREATCLRVYGAANFLSTKEAQEKRRESTLARFGVAHTSMLPEVRAKMSAAHKKQQEKEGE